MIQSKYTDPEYAVGGLHIFSNPPGADIYIDYKPVRDSAGNIVKTPAILTDIPQGLHTITFKFIGYHDDIITAEVVGGYYSSVYGVLLPFPVPIPPT
jgi:hypothetical protein